MIYIKKYESISLEKALAYYRISENQRSNNKFKTFIRIYKVFGDLPNNNFFKQNINTFNWIFNNSVQRIFYKKNNNKEKLKFLKSLIFNF